MKKLFYSVPLFLILASLFFSNFGCKNEDSPVTPSVDTNIQYQTTSAKNFPQIIKLLADANGFMWAISNNITPSLGGCPRLYHDTTLAPRVITVDYGAFPGCGSFDNVKRSGIYTLSYYTNPAKDSIYAEISFTDFRIYKYNVNTDTNVIRVTGNLKLSSKKLSSTSYRFHSGGEVYLQTLNDGNKILTITSLDGTANLNDLSIITDDTYSLTSSGEISDNGNVFSIQVKSSSPLQIKGDCRYPLSGIATFTKGGIAVDCDYSPEASACDAIVKIVKGSYSKTLDLTNLDF